MCRFIESINCEEGRASLLGLHQKRVNRTFERYFTSEPLQLEDIIKETPLHGKFKCRIEYGEGEHWLEYLPYRLPQIKSLQVVSDDNVSYSFKSLDRKLLTDLFGQRASADDIIIAKDGWLTDSYFANLALFDGKDWWTPSTCLLKGIKREYLLCSGILQEADIAKSDLGSFQKISLINALLDLDQISIPIKNVHFS